MECVMAAVLELKDKWVVARAWHHYPDYVGPHHQVVLLGRGDGEWFAVGEIDVLLNVVFFRRLTRFIHSHSPR